MLVLSLSSDMSHNLTCTAIGNPRPTMMWLLNNAPLQMTRNQVSLILYHLSSFHSLLLLLLPLFSLIRVASLLCWILSAVLMVVPILVLLLILLVWI